MVILMLREFVVNILDVTLKLILNVFLNVSNIIVDRDDKYFLFPNHLKTS